MSKRALLLALVVGTSLFSIPLAARAAPSPVVVIFMENKSATQVSSSPDMPYLHAFAAGGRYFSTYTEGDKTGPSMPDYLQVAAGSSCGWTTDTITPGAVPTSACSTTVWNQLQTAGVSWGVYEDAMPAPCASNVTYRNASLDTPYALKHNPATPFASIWSDQALCQAHVLPFTSFDPAALPAVSFIAPGICNDQHGTTDTSYTNCLTGSSALDKRGDDWLAAHVPAMLAQGATVFITYDEAGTTLYAAEQGPGITPSIDPTPYSHYSVLAAVEDRYGLPRLAGAIGVSPLPIGGAIDTDPPTAPGKPTGSSASTGTITINWTASTDASPPITYRIYRDADLTNPVGTTTSTTFTDINLTPGSQHTYTVSAVDNVGNGPTLGLTSDPITVTSAIFADDFSSGDFSKWTGVTRLTIDNGTGGVAPPSATAQTTAQTGFAFKNLTGTFSTICVSENVNVASRDASSTTLLRLRTAANGAIAKVFENSGGILYVRSDASNTQFYSGKALGTGWHNIELCGTVGTSGTWDLYLDGTKIVNAWVANTGTTPVGRVEIGNATAVTATINFDDIVVGSVVVGSPVVSGFNPSSGQVGDPVTITGTGFTGASLVTFGGHSQATLSVNSDTSISTTVPAGALTGVICVTTPVNTGCSASTFTVTVTPPPPVVSGFNPSSGQVGDPVTITGTGFTGASLVTFGGHSQATLSVNSDTSISTTVPAGALTGVICVTTPVNTGCSASTFTVTVTSAIFADDFSSGDFSKWTGVTRLTIDNGTGGVAPPSATAQTTAQTGFAFKNLTGTFSTICVSENVNVASRDASSTTLLRLRTAANGAIAKVFENSGGILYVRSDASNTQFYSGKALGTGWHNIELCGTVGTSGTWDLYLDGTKIVNAWVANTGTTPVGRVEIGNATAVTATINFDDIVIDQNPG